MNASAKRVKGSSIPKRVFGTLQAPALPPASSRERLVRQFQQEFWGRSTRQHRRPPKAARGSSMSKRILGMPNAPAPPRGQKWFRQVVLASGSCKWFLQVFLANGSCKWFLQVVPAKGSCKWLLQVVPAKWFLQVALARGSCKWFCKLVLHVVLACGCYKQFLLGVRGYTQMIVLIQRTKVTVPLKGALMVVCQIVLFCDGLL